MQRVGEEVDPESTFAVGVGAFARLLGLAFAVAFCSLGVQAAGLLGEGGIQPLARLVEWETLPALDGFLDMPTLFWLGQSDGMIRSVWVLGALSGIAVALGFVPRLFLLLATACWLSFTALSIPPTGSQGLGLAFLGYAWDGLLVELGCVAVLVAPSGLRSRGSAAPSRFTVIALRILLVRIVFGAALSPYLLGDGSWSADGALAQHLWTTPLPSWPGLVAAGGGAGFFVGTADLLTELLGLVLIFGVFGPRGVRHGVLLLLIVTLAAQAVFVPRGVWPLAVAALALSSIDDAAFGRLKLVAAARPHSGGLLSLLSSAALAALLAIGLYVTASDLGSLGKQDAPSGLRLAVGRWQVANHYAPLVDVPPDRPTLTIFGSADGETWEPIDLRSSPRDPFEAPPGPSLHLRRLDWAMDRAARQIKAGEMPPPWLVLTMIGLLEGRADVRGLLRDGPFADVPPRALRMELHDLTPASAEERADRGMWWYRWPGLDVGAPVMVEEGRLVPARF